MAFLALVGLMGLLIDLIAPEAARVFYGIANGLNWLMVHSGDPFVRWGISSARIPEYSGWPILIYVLYCLPLSALAFSLSRWRPLLPLKDKARWTARLTPALMLAQAFLLVVVITHPLSAGRTSEMRVDFLDVGQGDSALITMPGGTTMLVDGGGRQNFVRQGSGEREKEPFVRDVRGVGEAVVSEYLWWRGLDRIDYVVATHADADHIDGLNDVARNFSVRAALVARSPLKDAEFANFYQNASDIGMPIFLVGSGDVLRFGGISASILWPPAAVNDEAGSRNNDSIVMRLRFDERSILFTGDIERPAEAAILALEPGLQVDVVKVAHHGSKTSSTQDFIKGTRAKLAVISVGRTSIFGHPHKEVVERWHNLGAEVLTTGQSGMITVTTEGKNLQLETFVKGH
jgi:competence protein ComEC